MQQYRSEAQAMLLLEELERKEALFEILVQGVAVWQLFRFEACYLLQNMSTTSTHPVPFGRLKRLSRLMVRAFFDFTYLVFCKKKRYLLVSHDALRAKTSDGHYSDKHFSPLLPDLTDYLFVDVSPQTPHKGRQHSRLSTAIPSLFGIISKRLTKISPEETQAIHRISEACRAHPELASISPKKIRDTIQIFFLERQCWKTILKRLGKPVVALATVCQYSLNAAASDCGTRVAEFQHGIHTRYHPCFLPAEGTPGVSKSNLILRDAFILYSFFWLDEISARNSISAEQAVVGGFPWLESWRKQRQLCPPNGNASSIVCTLQGISTQTLLKFIREAWVLLPDKTMLLYIKLHPAKPSEYNLVSSLMAGIANVHILRGDDSPSTHELLAKAAWHVSISSATLYDSLAIGTPNCIIPLQTHEIAEQLCEAGLATIVANPRELADVLASAPPEVFRYTEQFCKTHGVKTICTALEDLYTNSPCRKKPDGIHAIY